MQSVSSGEEPASPRVHSSNCRLEPTSAHPALPTSSAVAGYQPVPAQPSAPCSIARPAKPHARSSCITDAFSSGSLLRQPSTARPRSRPSLQMAFEPPHPSFQALPSAKIFVDLFSGASAPLSAAIGALGLARLEPLDKLHGCHFDLLDDRHFQDLCLLASSGIVGAASAAPPCASFSRARLRPGARCPSAQLGIPQAYRPPLWRKAPNCLSHRLSTAAPDMFSLLSVHMAVSSCSRIQPPACFGWTPLSAPGCWYMLRSARKPQPVSLECLCLRPGHSGATMMSCHPWDAAARILLVFIRPLLASATLTAPLPHVTQRAILSPWPPPSHPAAFPFLDGRSH